MSAHALPFYIKVYCQQEALGNWVITLVEQAPNLRAIQKWPHEHQWWSPRRTTTDMNFGGNRLLRGRRLSLKRLQTNLNWVEQIMISKSGLHWILAKELHYIKSAGWVSYPLLKQEEEQAYEEFVNPLLANIVTSYEACFSKWPRSRTAKHGTAPLRGTAAEREMSTWSKATC